MRNKYRKYKWYRVTTYVISLLKFLTIAEGEILWAYSIFVVVVKRIFYAVPILDRNAI